MRHVLNWDADLPLQVWVWLVSGCRPKTKAHEKSDQGSQFIIYEWQDILECHKAPSKNCRDHFSADVVDDSFFQFAATRTHPTTEE